MKIIIYQVFTRIFGNKTLNPLKGGSITDNGCGKMNDFDKRTLTLIKELGATHIWYTGVIRYASQTDYSQNGIPNAHPNVVKGKAGSPYAITDYYDVDPDLAVNVDNRMDEFQALVHRTHQAGMKVIIDFVPNHVARQYHSICKPEGVRDLGEDDATNLHFSPSNNFYYCSDQPLDLSDITPDASYVENPAKATGNNVFSNRPTKNDWYETIKLNYGIDFSNGASEHFQPIPNTWSKMTDILLFWAAKGIDGFRCDMAEMVPPAFWAWAIDKVKYRFPNIIFIGEVYNPSLYTTYINAGFDYLYDKVGMYDCLRGVICQQRPAADITHQWQATDHILDHMLYFLENHDEQRIASTFFANEPHKAFPALLVSTLLHKGPFMLYAGQEYGEQGMDDEGFSGIDGRTSIFDYWMVDTIRRGYYDRRKLTVAQRQLVRFYQQILSIANSEETVAQGDMFDLMYVNPHLQQQQFVFLRKFRDQLLLVVANFSDQNVQTHVNIPAHAFQFLSIPQSHATALDLLSNQTIHVDLKPDTPISLSLPSLGGRVYKIALSS